MHVGTDNPQFDRRCDPAEAVIHIVRGCDAILRMQGKLVELSARCGQDGAMDHLEYLKETEVFE